MKNWNNLEHGDKVRNIYNGDILEGYIWRGEKYLASEDSMWLVSEFDCNDWEIVKDLKKFCEESGYICHIDKSMSHDFTIITPRRLKK